MIVINNNLSKLTPESETTTTTTTTDSKINSLSFIEPAPQIDYFMNNSKLKMPFLAKISGFENKKTVEMIYEINNSLISIYSLNPWYDAVPDGTEIIISDIPNDVFLPQKNIFFTEAVSAELEDCQIKFLFLMIDDRKIKIFKNQEKNNLTPNVKIFFSPIRIDFFDQIS